MIIKKEMTELEELYFQMWYGSLFATSLNLEYYKTINQVCTDKSDTLLLTKVKEATRACNLVYGIVKQRLLSDMEDEQKIMVPQAIEVQKDLAYLIFGLTGEQQEKVKLFIKDIQQ